MLLPIHASQYAAIGHYHQGPCMPPSGCSRMSVPLPGSDSYGRSLMQGYAVKVGMLAARGTLLLLMDADGATRIADLAKLEADLKRVCPALSGRACDPVSCARQLRMGRATVHCWPR